MRIVDLAAPMPMHSEAYRKWVRSLPSQASGQIGCIAHHRIGHRCSQVKTSDFETMPLTPDEHRRLHAGVHAFEREFGKSELEMVARTLLEAIRVGVLVLDERRARELS